MKYFILIVVGLIWGSQFTLNELVLESFSPIGLTGLRMFFGFLTISLLILVIPKERKKSLGLTKKLFFLLVLVGFMEAALPFLLISYGQVHLDSSVAAMIMGSIPLFTILLHTFVEKSHQITRYEIMGLSLSFIGLLVLFLPNVKSFDSSLLAYIAILSAAMAFAISFLLMNKIPHNLSALHTSRFILFFYSSFFLVFWYLYENPVLPTELKPWLAVVVLGSLASGIVYVLYIMLIRISGPTFASLSNYIVPLFGVFLGVVFLNEQFTLSIGIALSFIVLGLFVVNIKKH